MWPGSRLLRRRRTMPAQFVAGHVSLNLAVAAGVTDKQAEAVRETLANASTKNLALIE